MKSKNTARKHNSNILKRRIAGLSDTTLARTENRMLLAAKIAAALKEKNWSKIFFAEQMKQKPSVITRWLSGTHNFTADTLSDIQNVLGIRLLQTDSIDNIRDQTFVICEINFNTPATLAQTNIPNKGWMNVSSLVPAKKKQMKN